MQKKLIWTEEPSKQLVGKFSLFVNIAMARFSYITSVTVFFKTKVHFLVFLRGTLLFSFSFVKVIMFCPFTIYIVFKALGHF